MANETRVDHPHRVKLRPGHFRNLPESVLPKLEEVYGGILDAVLSRCYTISSALDRGESIYPGPGAPRVTSYNHGLHIEHHYGRALFAVIWTTLPSEAKYLWLFDATANAGTRAIWNKLLEYMELTEISPARADELNALMAEVHADKIATCCIYLEAPETEGKPSWISLSPAGVSLDSLLLPMLDWTVLTINNRNGGIE